MASSDKYLNEKRKAVNEVWERYAKEGVSNEYIYHNYIKDQFFISRGTFYRYLKYDFSTEPANEPREAETTND